MASSGRERREKKDPDARIPRCLGSWPPLSPPYLLLRRWRQQLLGPAVLSWFRAAGLERCCVSAGVGRARVGAALGAGRGGPDRGVGGGEGGGSVGPSPRLLGEPRRWL